MRLYSMHTHCMYTLKNMHIALHLSHSMYTREPAQYKGKMCTIALIHELLTQAVETDLCAA